ncbi:MAG: hypothetical protein HY328_09775 [Chloroflexi bacterium]|nr:hypothetical protein [Chloroflexota bacterium]
MFQNSTLPSVSVDITRNIAGSLPRLRAWQGLARLETLLPRTFREYLLWLLLMAGVMALALLQVSATLQISQTQVELDDLRNQYLLIEQENAQLLWEISHYTTLERVEAEAAAAGFVPALRRRYVTPEPLSATYSALSRDPAAAAEVAESFAWSVDVDAESRQFAVEFSQLWDGWSGRWKQLRQAIADSAVAAGDAVQQQMLKIDISRYLWIGKPNE